MQNDADDLLEELEVSQICLKFNRAFLAESHPSGPEIAEAVSEYITMQEENGDGKRRKPQPLQPLRNH